MQNKYVGFWNRAVAISLDQIILGMLTIFILAQILPFVIDYSKLQSSSNREVSTVIEMLDNLVFIEVLSVTIWSAICAYFYTTRWQATPGKKIMGMKVVKSNGARLSLKDGFLRTASLPFFLLLLQIFERNEIYSKLEVVKTSPQNYTTVEELALFVFNSDIIAYSDLTVMLVGSFWLLLTAFTREKTAFHDILFDTRVIYAKK
jgi:uncharacterized RDD family membrane protein YckC